MLYFSELRAKRVQTEDGIQIGILDDLIFLALETARITKAVIKSKNNSNIIIPADAIKKINGHITIQKNYTGTEVGLNELYVLRNILDKQIIDLKGNKLVRVNDVAIQDKPFLYIAGVDIGLLGILRSLGLESLFHRLSNFWFIKHNTQFLSWADIQPLELAQGKVKLNVTQEKLRGLHPADLADYLETTNIRNISKIIDLLGKEYASEVVSELNPNYQITLLRKLGDEKAVKIISLMDPDEAVDVLLQFSPRRRQLILEKMDETKRREIENLLRFSETSIGPYLNMEFIAVKPENIVRQIIDQIKKETGDIGDLNCIYVTNKNDLLIGVFNLHELLLQSPDTPVYRFMIQNVTVTHLNSPANTVLRKMIKYHLYELPVVDAAKKMIGIVKRDDIGELFLDRI